MSKCEDNESSLIVKTLNGQIKGKEITTVFGRNVKVFHKIPYAKPPIGKLRFKDPQPVENWNVLLDCTIESSGCPMYDFSNKSIIGDEDALYLNAYTKNTKPEKLAPVMAYIHGGGFVMGSSSSKMYSPDFLLEKDIVFFSFNYRLGPFGFLSFDDPELEVPGNAGLKDQTMALRWIKSNTHVFGGDPNNITLFGESAGGASVHYHMISDLSKNLFHKAIPMSGVAINEWAIQSTTKNFSLALAKQLGWNENDGTKKALEILQNTEVNEILRAVNTMIPSEEKLHSLQFAFVPSIEPYIAAQSFLTKPPIEAMQNAWSDKIPIMIGASSEEGLIMYMVFREIQESKEVYDSLGDFQYVVDIHLKLKTDSDEKKRIGAALKEIYYGTEQPSLINADNYVNMMGDRYFSWGIHEVVRTRSNKPQQSAATFYYRFNFDDKFADGLKLMFGLTKPGVSHGSDICYIFKMASFHQNGGLEPGSAAFKTVKRMVGLFTSFAASGNPNCSETATVYWEPVNKKTPPFKVLNISNELSFIDLPETERLISFGNVYKNVKCKK